MVSYDTAKIYKDSLVLIRLKDKNISIAGKIISITKADISLEHPRYGKSSHSLENVIQIQEIPRIDGGDDDERK